MLEVEVKILEIDKENIISKIEALGAKKIFEGEILVESFINTDHKRIRLRKKGNISTINYKHNIESAGIRVNNEYETILEDFDVMREILLSIGFSRYRTSKKYRISYVLSDIRFDIDKYDGIPWFMEVESDTKEKVEKGVLLIGYTMKDTSPFTDREVREYYGTLAN